MIRPCIKRKEADQSYVIYFYTSDLYFQYIIHFQPTFGANKNASLVFAERITGFAPVNTAVFKLEVAEAQDRIFNTVAVVGRCLQAIPHHQLVGGIAEAPRDGLRQREALNFARNL